MFLTSQNWLMKTAFMMNTVKQLTNAVESSPIIVQIYLLHPNKFNTGSRSTLNFRAGSTFPVPVCTLALWTGLAGETRLTRPDFMLHIG